MASGRAYGMCNAHVCCALLAVMFLPDLTGARVYEKSVSASSSSSGGTLCSDAWTAQVLSAVGSYRAQLGLSSLTCKESASKDAKVHAEKLCSGQELTHEGKKDRCARAGWTAVCVEKVTATYTFAMAPQQAFQQWRDSASGNYNVFKGRDFKELGFGYSRCSNGKIQWVLLLGTGPSGGPSSPGPSPSTTPSPSTGPSSLPPSPSSPARVLRSPPVRSPPPPRSPPPRSTPSPPNTPSPAPTPSGSGTGCFSSWVSEAVDITNSLRAAVGASKVSCIEAACSAAIKHSQDMCGTGVLTHDGFSSRCSASGFNTGCGENVAYNWDSSATAAQTVMKQWKESSGHYANIIEKSYTHVGLGYAKCSDGKVMWTQILGKLN